MGLNASDARVCVCVCVCVFVYACVCEYVCVCVAIKHSVQEAFALSVYPNLSLSDPPTLRKLVRYS